MTGYKHFVSTGIVVGGALAAAYVASRRFHGNVPSLVSWSRVRKVAVKNCDKARPIVEIEDKEYLQRKYGNWVRVSEELIANYIGKDLPRPLEHVHVFGRPEWIDANITNFRMLFDPFEQMNREAMHDASAGTRLFGGFNQFFLSSQMGMLLGYLGQRVLGQYDLALLGHEPVTSGRLYFVEPNIAQLQQRLNLDGDEFRLWIALHETTHAYEFEANPWLRSHMNGLIQRYFESVGSDFMTIKLDRHAMTDLFWRIAGNVFSSKSPVEWVMTPHQRAIFRETQALMCLLEGFSNHVMQAVGEKLLPSYHTMKERFEERSKEKPPLERLFAKLMGMDMKFEQYVLGEQFVNRIVAERGVSFMNQVWESPEHLPTMEEIRQPERWIERVSKMPTLQV